MPTHKPNFFIVGAPKCGTTAIYHSLLQHPEVYLPFSDSPESYWINKEPMFFCDDLGIPDWMRISREEDYRNLFQDAGSAPRIGEASAQYLVSPGAARRIREFADDDCRIIIILRPPVDWMRSWHHDCLQYSHETVGDFRRALALESEREHGREIPACSGFRGCLAYRRGARFSEQVERYFDLFGRERVKVVLMEDLICDGEGLLREIAAFLGISRDFPFSLDRQNDSRRLSRTHLLEFRLRRKLHQHPRLDRFAAGPLSLYRRAALRLLPALSDKRIDPELRAQLTEEFRPEVDRLSALLGRDLSHWHGPGVRAEVAHLPR